MSINKNDSFKVEFDSLKRDLMKIASRVGIGYSCDLDLTINDYTLCYFDSYDPDSFEFLECVQDFRGSHIMPIIIRFYNVGKKILSKYQEVK